MVFGKEDVRLSKEIAYKEMKDALPNKIIAESILMLAILIPRRVLKKGYIEMEVLPEKIRDAIGAKIGNGFISFLYVDEAKGIDYCSR